MSHRAHTIRVIGAFAAVYLIWGSTYLGMKVAVTAIPPLPMGAIRFTLAGAALLVVLTALRRVELGWLRSFRYWRSALLTGSLMLVGANGLLAFSLYWIPSGTGALVVAVTPVWLVILDRLQMRRGAPPARVVAGLVLGAIGVGVLMGVGASAAAPSRDEILGIAMALVSTICWALGSILGRRTPQPPDILVGASMQMIAGGALMIVLSLLVQPWMSVDWSSVSWRHWGAVAYLVVAGSMIGFTAYVWLLRNASASKVATYAYVNPMVAVLLGWLLLDEVPTWRVCMAAPLILFAVVLLQWTPRRASTTATVVMVDGSDRAAAAPTTDAVEPDASRRMREPEPVTPRSTSLPGDGR